MKKARVETGELALLGTFGVFVAGFLFDIRELPTEGKLLSYIAGPIALALIVLCAWKALLPGRKREVYYGYEVSQDVEETPARREADAKEVREREQGRRRMWLTGGMSLFMFAGITLVGFYASSGLMLLLWFLIIKRVNKSTMALTVLMPVLLYVCFETLLDMGLPKGAILGWLGR